MSTTSKEANRMLKIKRVYEKKSANDGRRIYVDRLWPRGLSKEEVAIDEWLKELSPSNELRRWFGHEPDKFAEFRQKYIKELSEPEKTALIEHVKALAEKTDVTLLYSARDREYNNAVVLAKFIGKFKKENDFVLTNKR
jgi:uncharacterized protein YeaO (DUF488 family)